jgi:hypothetical protein
MPLSNLLNVDFVIGNTQEGNYISLIESDALKRHLASRAHALPASLTGAVAAASRQVPLNSQSSYLWGSMPIYPPNFPGNYQ